MVAKTNSATSRARAAREAAAAARSGANAAPAERAGTAASAKTRGSAAALAHVRGGSAANATQELDRVIHERLRLGIVSALAVNNMLSFNDLKALLETTDGNLSVHARKLEEAGYVQCIKRFEGRSPRTEYKLTAAGRRALERYLEHMEAVINAVRVD